MDKRSVTIKKLFIDCFRFWYILLLFFLLGAGLGIWGGRRHNQTLDKNYKEAIEEQEKEAAARLELGKDDVVDRTYTKAECEATLTDDAKSEVLEAYEWNLERRRRRAYLNDSALFNSDLYNYTSTVLQFHIVHEETDVDLLAFNSYVHGLKAYIEYDGLINEMYPSDLEKVRRLHELIGINDGGKDQYDEMLVVTVVEVDETKDMVPRITDLFLNYGKKLAQTYPGFSVELFSTNRSNYFNSSLTSALESYRLSLINYRNREDSCYKRLDYMQQAYYWMLYRGTEEATVQEVVMQGQTLKKKAVEEIEKPVKKSTKFYAIVGAIAGFIVGILFLFFKSLLSGRLIYQKDVKNIFDLRFCGTIREKAKKGIPGKLQKMEYPDAEDAENPSFLYLQVRELLKSADCQEAVLVGTLDFNEAKGIDQLITLAGKDGIRLTKECKFPEDLDAADAVLQNKNVFLVEGMHRSRIGAINKVVDFCRENQVDIHGVICLDGIKAK